MMLKWSVVSDLFDDVACRLSGPFSNVVLDYDLSVLAAYTDDRKFPGKPLAFHVGAKEFVENADDGVPVGKAIAPIVNLFHEAHDHGGQLLHEFHKGGALSGTLAFNYFACNSSCFYYGIDADGNPHEHYYHHPHEIAAQYVGVRDAFKFLSDVYDHDTATYMVKDYLYFRLAGSSEPTSRSEFVPSIKGCNSIDDILDRFDETFKTCARAKHLYVSQFSTDDCVHEFAEKTGKPWLPRQVARCKSGLRQDVMMTSALFAMDRNYEYGMGLKVFDGMDLDAKFIFKRFGQNSKLYEPDLGDVDLSMLESYDNTSDLSLSSLDEFQL